MNFDLNTLWFILIVVLYIGFFVLEGFDFGVGILLPILAKKDNERRAIINTVGPHWDGNEVWLLTAGGATFAAFPHWYATMFSGFYLALFLLLLSLIVRGVAFEFRSKREDAGWRALWDWCLFGGSLVASLLLGVAFSNLGRGLPIDANMVYTGGFWYLLNPYSILGGVAVILLFMLHGAIFLSLKTTDPIKSRAEGFARKVWPWTTLVFFGFVVYTYFATDLSQKLGIFSGIVLLVAAVTIILAGVFLRRDKGGTAFTMSALNIAFTIVTLFTIMFPRVMISVTDPDYSLTIYNASSSGYTLTVMSIIALIFVPVVLAYQIWSYISFKKRISADPKDLTY
jgi:cytochrome d ubiquinol oxidase subunit II